MDNINELLNIDFSTVNDEFNWLSNGTIQIETIDGQLRLIPEAATSQFTRGLGNLDVTNDRIRLRVDLEVLRPQISLDETFCAIFGVYLGATLIDEFTLYLEDLVTGDRAWYNLDRIYHYDGVSGAVSLRITTPEGFANEMYLNYLKCEDFRYNDNDVRTYFLIDGLFENLFNIASAAVQLLEWKVDGVETLTAAFFSENNVPGGNPELEWKFALADIDGSNRNADLIDPNTFNPFVSEWGLDFSDVAGNHFGGKPTGVTSGSDYGSGILQIGFEKPEIINGVLIQKNGAFFIDIDYTKDLKVVFNALYNTVEVDVFNSPKMYKRFTILWSASECAKHYYSNDILNNEAYKDEIDNGFLSGITGVEIENIEIGCNESFIFDGESGVFEFVMNFGTDIGEAGIDYQAFSVPDKFEIEWNGNTYSTGYVGLSFYDQQLLNLGISPTEINTGDPTTGEGTLSFIKDSAEPTTAIIRVTAPLSSTGWEIVGRCPDVPTLFPPTVTIDTAITNISAGDSTQFDITSNDVDGTIISWIIDWGGEGTTDGVGAPPASVNKTFTTFGTKEITITVTDNDGLIGTDTIEIQVFGSQEYSLTGIFYITCGDSGMLGNLEVISGTVTVKNNFIDINGAPFSALITIDGVQLDESEQRVLGVGNYPFSSNPIDCSGGNGYNELIVF